MVVPDLLAALLARATVPGPPLGPALTPDAPLRITYFGQVLEGDEVYQVIGSLPAMERNHDYVGFDDEPSDYQGLDWLIEHWGESS